MSIQTMAEALSARDAGMQSASEHAEQDAPGWGERAYQAIKGSRYLATRDFTMEQAMTYLYAWGHLDQPAELRATGAVTSKLIRNGVIEKIGFAPAASSHGSPKALYRLTRTS